MMSFWGQASWAIVTRVTRLGEILPFELLFKGPGENLGTNMV
jgi:hypothetical protein